MNIFVLEKDPVLAAQHQCDKHVVKMVLETAQLLCSSYEQGVAPYRRTHYNHPCAKWVRESADNYKWLCIHGLGLADEYTYRYDKRHKSTNVIRWCIENIDKLNLPKIGLTTFAQAMPDECKNDDAVEAYRTYYRTHKANIATWKKNRQPPSWWKQIEA